MAVFIAFWVLLLVGLKNKSYRERTLQRTSLEWFLDGFGLFAQGIVVPLIQSILVAGILKMLFPATAGSLNVSPLVAFLGNVLVIDYLYYWNHRLLHHDNFWWVHRIHHSVRHLDVIATSRNTIWSNVFILYWWVNGVMLFLLAEPAPYLAGIAVTAILDIWRHSGEAGLFSTSFMKRLSRLLLTPLDHAWHHSTHKARVNYGGNFNFWDKLHGTYYSAEVYPAEVGIESTLSPLRQALWPKEASK